MQARMLMVPLLGCLGLAAPAQAPALAATAVYRTAWTTAMSDGGTVSGANYTCRFVARSTATGDAVEVRLSNSLGTAPLTLDRASVGIRSTGESLAAAPVLLTFAGRRSVTIAAGAEALSDPAKLAVAGGQDVAVSLFVSMPSAPLTYHALGLETNACTSLAGAAGDHTRDVAGSAFTGMVGAFDWWLDALVVHTASAGGTVVALGDSITDGYCTGLDAHQRWTDVLAARLGGAIAVANQGISGNRLEGGGYGPDALTRLQRDVLSIPGVSTLFVYEGTNDIGNGADGSTVLSAMQSIVAQAHAAGLHVVGATIIPRLGSVLWTPVQETYRQQVNLAIRLGTVFDEYVDFDQIESTGGALPVLNPAYDCGDRIHPNATGLAAMGNGVPLADLQ